MEVGQAVNDILKNVLGVMQGQLNPDGMLAKLNNNTDNVNYLHVELEKLKVRVEAEAGKTTQLF